MTMPRLRSNRSWWQLLRRVAKSCRAASDVYSASREDRLRRQPVDNLFRRNTSGLGAAGRRVGEASDASFFDDLDGARLSGRSASFSNPLPAQMTPTSFEHHCAEMLHRQGWRAHTTKRSGDQGIDVFAQKANVSVVIQCKFYNSAVGNRAVQEVFAARAHARAQIAAVVTNAKFTRSAVELAQSTGVLLLHMSDLMRADSLFGVPQQQEAPVLSRPQIPQRVVRRCLRCRLQLNVPTGKSGTVRCPACRLRFQVST